MTRKQAARLSLKSVSSMTFAEVELTIDRLEARLNVASLNLVEAFRLEQCYAKRARKNRQA